MQIDASKAAARIEDETSIVALRNDSFRWKTHEQVTWTNTNSSTSKRGIVLLRATQVPIPGVYKKTYGAQGKPHESLILELMHTIRKSTKLPVIVILDEQPVSNLTMLIDGYIVMSFNHTQPWREKIPALLETPFEETLYIDTDMKVCQDVEPLFDVLSAGNDMGMVRVVPQAAPKTWNKPAHAFDFYGCFILFRKSKLVYDTFQRALTYTMADQAALNAALKAVVSQPNVYTFPATVSAVCRYNDLILPLNGPVYTIHGIHAKCSDINVNQGSRYIRCFQGKSGAFKVMNYTSVHTLLDKLKT